MELLGHVTSFSRDMSGRSGEIRSLEAHRCSGREAARGAAAVRPRCALEARGSDGEGTAASLTNGACSSVISWVRSHAIPSARILGPENACAT